MQKIKILIILAFITVLVSSCAEKSISSDNEFSNNLVEIKNSIDEINNSIAVINDNIDDVKNIVTQNSSISNLQEFDLSVIDYPLIDIPIRYNELDITLIIGNNVLSPEKSEYFFTNDKEVLEKMQCDFNVMTFPKGHGTTPDSIIYVYQDSKLIKEVPFLGIYINDDKFDLVKLSKDEVERRIQQLLPAPI